MSIDKILDTTAPSHPAFVADIAGTLIKHPAHEAGAFGACQLCNPNMQTRLVTFAEIHKIDLCCMNNDTGCFDEQCACTCTQCLA